MIKDNPIFTTTVITLFTVGFCLVAHFLPSHPNKETYFDSERNQAIYNQLTSEGTHPNPETASPNLITGIGRFTIKKLDGVHFHIPRFLLSFVPAQPDCEVGMLRLVFYLPDVASKIIRLKNKVNIFLHPSSHYILCLKGKCLKPEFALFQGYIEGMQSQLFSIKEGKQKFVMTGLESGEYNAKLNLVCYENSQQTSTATSKKKCKCVYLPPKANPINPLEWITCEDNLCVQTWFRNNMVVFTRFNKDLLPRHAEIRKKIDQYLIDSYMKKDIECRCVK